MINDLSVQDAKKLEQEIAYIFNGLVGHRQKMFPGYDQEKVLQREFPLAHLIYQRHYAYRRS